MKRTTPLISGLATLILLGFAATSFAGLGIPNNSPNIGTEAGVDIVASEKAKTAAANYNLNAAQLAQLSQIGTEAGSEVIASSTARKAVTDYVYNAEHLAWVGTEAGRPPVGLGIDQGYFHAGTASEQVAGKDSLNTDAICNRC